MERESGCCWLGGWRASEGVKAAPGRGRVASYPPPLGPGKKGGMQGGWGPIETKDMCRTS